MTTTPVNEPLAQGVRQRLSERIRRSVEAHREFRTVRREQLAWAMTAPGCAEATLARTEYSHVTLVRLDAGAELAWPAGAFAQEVLVVDGGVLAEPASAAAQPLTRWSLALRRAADAGVLRAHGGAAQLYVRNVQVPLSGLPAVEAAWWNVPAARLQCIDAERRRWRDGFEGVQTLALWGTPDVVSMLVRFAPGAGVPDHRHAVHEDCLMLEGSMFLGDIVLRAGDYQLAPAGGGHFGEMSDVGGTFFFHGGLDPVLVPPR